MLLVKIYADSEAPDQPAHPRSESYTVRLSVEQHRMIWNYGVRIRHFHFELKG